MFVKINDVRVLNLKNIVDIGLHNNSSKYKYRFKTLEDGEYFTHEFESVKELNASLQYFDTIQEALESFNSEVKSTTNFMHENTSVKESNAIPFDFEFKEISNLDFLEISAFNSNSLIKVDYVNWKGNLKKDLLIIPKNFYHGFNSFHPSPEAQLFLNGYDYEEYINNTTDAVAQKAYLMTSMSNIRIMSKKR